MEFVTVVFFYFTTCQNWMTHLSYSGSNENLNPNIISNSNLGVAFSYFIMLITLGRITLIKWETTNGLDAETQHTIELHVFAVWAGSIT